MLNLFRKPIGKTGDLKPSPEDKRDLLLSSYMPRINTPDKMPRVFDYDILDQGQEPSCVGFSCAVLKQYAELKEKEYHIFDGSWIYRECKKIDGIPNFQGTYLRSGMSILKNVGAKPLNGTDPSKYRIASYARVDDMTYESLKQAITLYGVIIAGFRGTNEGWRAKTVRPPRAGESIWGHAVSLVAFDDNYIIGQNSWGERSHDKGLFRIPKDYMPFEGWVRLVDMTNEPRAEKETGWVAQNFLDANGRVIPAVGLNVREQPTTSAKILKTLPIGTQTEHAGTANRFSNNLWWREIIING